LENEITEMYFYNTTLQKSGNGKNVAGFARACKKVKAFSQKHRVTKYKSAS
jgi:hypothetical protein